MKTFTIEVNERQLSILIQATDVIARAGILQFGTALEYLAGIHGAFIDWDSRKDLEQRLRLIVAEDTNKEIYKRMSDSPNSHLGIHGFDTPDVAQVAWDMHQVFRNSYHWAKLENDPEKIKEANTTMFVVYDPPHKSSQEPLAKCKLNDNN